VRRNESGGAKFLSGASAEISMSGDIEFGAHAANSPTNTIPASKDQHLLMQLHIYEIG